MALVILILFLLFLFTCFYLAFPFRYFLHLFAVVLFITSPLLFPFLLDFLIPSFSLLYFFRPSCFQCALEVFLL